MNKKIVLYYMNLPNDLKIHIYRFLSIHDVKKIETKKSNYLILIRLENKNKPEYHDKIFKNIITKTCFNCPNKLYDNYVLGICSECNFIIDKTLTYPLFCRNCIKFKGDRTFLARPCLICNKYSAFLGIEKHLS
tara:strand:- start:531 stop:932 length:402 start_codon:yes stop_codon:yes gene_type:complete